MSSFVSLTLTNSQLAAALSVLSHAVYLKSSGVSTGAPRDLLSGNPSKTQIIKDKYDMTKLMRALKLENEPSPLNSPIGVLSFTKGWIAACTYNLGNALQLNCGNQNRRARAGQEPESLLFACYYTWSYQYDHSLKQGLVYFSDECSDLEKTKILQLLTKPSATKALKHHSEEEPQQTKSFKDLNWRKSQDKTLYAKQFEAIQNYIHAGDCYQANLTQRLESEHALEQTQLIELFMHHAELSRANYCAYFAMSETHQLLSFSPEQFLQVCGQEIQTMPIKGTVKSLGAITTRETNALRTPKNLAENLMIVDLLRNDLGKVCIDGSISVDKLFDIESYENVHHLVSTIKGTIKEDISPIEAFFSAFPGGSITGAPKIRAMEIINELEAHERNFYCGSIFYHSASGHFDSSILIRTIERKDDKLLCWGGGGIVADSKLDDEYQESLDKVSHLMDIDK